jgi:hypothetical protein
MKRAAIIGLAVSGESTLLRGIGKYSEVRAELGKHITDSRFAEVFLCEPMRRYRPARAPVAALEPPKRPKAK